MRYSHLFGKTSKNAPSDADSPNARLLEQGGFVDQLIAGVYSYLPLGVRVLRKIENIIRQEMNALGAQEILMPALTPKENWETTGRWTDPGQEVMFQLKGRGDKEFALGWTHEEIVTPLAKKAIKSYRDLPLAVYQIQDKFRNEPRAKSGLLRGREFWMKDMYSFHKDEADLDVFYEKSKQAYFNVFRRCGLDAKLVAASGGAFSEYSHEFQVPTESGEDTIFVCNACGFAFNKEIQEKFGSLDSCTKCGGELNKMKAIEVGNIFPLKTRFTDAFDVSYADEDGKLIKVQMGCYGIGPSRVIGTIVEAHHDDKGIIWPKSVAPFQVHIVALKSKDEEQQRSIDAAVTTIEQELGAKGIEVLIDDRDKGAGEKFADADLIGIPLRLVISEKSLAAGGVEWKERSASEAKIAPLDRLAALVLEWWKA